MIYTRTCCNEPRKYPALTKTNRVPLIFFVLAQNLCTSGPMSWLFAITVISGPIPHEDSVIILAV